MTRLLKCGHTDSSLIFDKEKKNWVRACGLCNVTEEETQFPLEGREAICSCGHRQPSAKFESLAFFEFRGEGSKKAKIMCKHCGYYDTAHSRPDMECKTFEPKGAFEFDSFYCGCRGWE
jgi:hypothetical protein